MLRKISVTCTPLLLAPRPRPVDSAGARRPARLLREAPGSAPRRDCAQGHGGPGHDAEGPLQPGDLVPDAPRVGAEAVRDLSRAEVPADARRAGVVGHERRLLAPEGVEEPAVVAHP